MHTPIYTSAFSVRSRRFSMYGFCEYGYMHMWESVFTSIVRGRGIRLREGDLSKMNAESHEGMVASLPLSMPRRTRDNMSELPLVAGWMTDDDW